MAAKKTSSTRARKAPKRSRKPTLAKKAAASAKKATKRVGTTAKKVTTSAAKTAKKVLANPKRAAAKAGNTVHATAGRARKLGETIATAGQLLKDTADVVDAVAGAGATGGSKRKKGAARR